MRSYVAGLNPRLPAPVWILLSGSFANAFGNGVVFPYLLIYLHNVRGISLGTAGVVLAASSIAGLVGGPLAGTLIDAVGPRRVLVVSMVLSAIGFGGFAFVHHVPAAFAAGVVSGLGTGAFWPSHATLVGLMTERESRHSAYAMQRVLNNLGIGVGGVVGGFIATTAHPSTYETLFVIDAVTFGAYLLALAFVATPPHAPPEDTPRGGYRTVVGHKTFLAYVVMNASLVSVGFALLGDIFPAFAKNTAHVTERGIGFCFLANTIVVGIAQMPVAKWLEGRRRMVAYTIEGVIWSASWLMVFAAGWWFVGVGAAVAFAFALSVFAIGECFHGTIQNALIADLARPGLLGRYLALNGFGFQLGGAAGRAAGGFALALAPHGLWAIAAALSLAAGMSALLLERVLPETIRRTPVPVAA
ncbi:MAG TPA: MFS transporter [Gaiellaceae bacterium]